MVALANQALSTPLILCGEVLGATLSWLDNVMRAKRRTCLPVVLTVGEI